MHLRFAASAGSRARSGRFGALAIGARIASVVASVAACGATGISVDDADAASAAPDLREPTAPGPDDDGHTDASAARDAGGSSPDATADGGPSQDGWTASAKSFDEVVAIAAHPTDGASFAALVTEDTVLRFRKTADLGATFEKARFVTDLGQAHGRVDGFAWKIHGAEMRLAIVARVSAPAQEIHVSTDAKYFFPRKGPTTFNPPSFDAIDIHDGVVAARAYVQGSGALLYSFPSGDSTVPGIGDTPLSGAFGGGPFARRPGHANQIVAASGASLVRCVDGSCATATTTASFTTVRAIAFSPHDDALVLAAVTATGTSKVLRSTDAGTTFTSVLEASIGEVAFGFDPRSGASNVYALAGEKVHRSADHGATWSDVSPPNLYPSESSAPRLLAVRADGGLVVRNNTFRYYFRAPD